MKRLLSIATIVCAVSASADVAADRTALPILDAPTLTAACTQAISDARARVAFGQR